ncbi:MAG TPA: hypothetical protein VN851_21640 [Thermoanaerobaculia bacterium]|nr:hypothetical protein [Thermoanaerobaculia bacterium]
MLLAPFDGADLSIVRLCTAAVSNIDRIVTRVLARSASNVTAGWNCGAETPRPNAALWYFR